MHGSSHIIHRSPENSSAAGVVDISFVLIFVNAQFLPIGKMLSPKIWSQISSSGLLFYHYEMHGSEAKKKNTASTKMSSSFRLTLLSPTWSKNALSILFPPLGQVRNKHCRQTSCYPIRRQSCGPLRQRQISLC